MTDHAAAAAQRAYARFAGLMFFVVLGFDVLGVAVTSAVAGGGGFADMSHRIAGSEPLYRIGLCCGLVGSLATVPLAASL